MAYSDIFQKQVIMRKVCYALIPLFIYSILLYGIAPIYQVAVAFLVGIFTEYIFEKGRKKKVSEAVLVTCFLYGLSLPPNLPVWMNAIGIFFAVFIAKAVFGGFGRNVYNPAITGRLFIYLAFPAALTSLYWCAVSPIGQSISGLLGNGEYTQQAVDAISVATPLVSLREGIIPPLSNLFLGLRSGSIGEGASFLLILVALYLVFTKTADWKLMVSTLLSATVFTAFFYSIGALPGFPEPAGATEGIKVVLAYLMSGSMLYVVVFMTTDPVSGPNNPRAKWIYGILIGVSTVLIRSFSGFPEGVSFAVMLGNTFACLFDEITPKAKPAKKPKPAAKAVEAKTN